MSTPSTLLLCAGAAAGLAGVWTLAGLSESSTLRSTPRVLAAAAIGLLGEALVYRRSPEPLRGELLLPLLFGIACVLALAVGAAKIEAALADKDGARVVRRSAGIVAGTFFGMAAVGAASLDLHSGSLALGRVSWALMFGLVAGTIVVFIGRARYAGSGLLSLAKRSLGLGVVGVALLAGAKLTAAPAPARSVVSTAPTAAPPSVSVAAVAAPASAEAPTIEAPARLAAAALATPSATSVTDPIASVSSVGVEPVAAAPDGILVETLSSRGLLEADARGGVTRRSDWLQACLTDPKNEQKGTLSLRIGIDPSGSVTFSRATGGDLKGTPLGRCLLAVFYRMGFASPAASSAGNAGFDITLRVP